MTTTPRSHSPHLATRMLGLIAFATILPGVAASGPPVLDCEPLGPARPICRFQNPEDIVALPGDEALLIGQYGESGPGNAGGLVVFDLETEEPTLVFRGGEQPAAAEAGWGDPTCTEPPGADFNAHGIDLVRREDGRLALLVVQHGSREAVEFFEVLGGGRRWRVAWRGCVPAPPDASLNEVAARPDGSFFTTKMISASAPLVPEFYDSPTGEAYIWRPGAGYSIVGGTAGAMPNGIVASPDGRFIYLNVTMESRLRKVEVATGRITDSVEVPMPDNVTWTPDGRLLVASLAASDPQDFEACNHLEGGACGIPFAIVAVDPDSMTNLGPVYSSEGRPMGAGTVGLQVGRELFVGSFRGDRILRVDLDAGTGPEAGAGSN